MIFQGVYLTELYRIRQQKTQVPIPNVMLNEPILLILRRVIIFNYGDYQSCLKFLFLKESSIFSFEHSAGEKTDGPDRKAAYRNFISYVNTFVPLSHK